MDNEKKQSELKKEKLIAYLIHCIDQEYKKPLEEIDMDYIDECVEFLLDLQGIDATLTPEVIKEKVSEISKEWIEEENCNEKLDKGENKKKSKKKSKKHVTVKRIWLIAACIGLLVALFALASVAFEWNVVDTIIEYFGSIDKAPEDEWFELNGDTIEKSDETRSYDNFEDFANEEEISILYPRNLPLNVKVNCISICEIEGKSDVSIAFNNNNLSCGITINSTISQEILNVYTETLFINNLECHFLEMKDVSVVQVYFEHNNNLYMYSYNDKQELINIIENLEEVQ